MRSLKVLFQPKQTSFEFSLCRTSVSIVSLDLLYENWKQLLIMANNQPAHHTRETRYGIKTISICLVSYLSLEFGVPLNEFGFPLNLEVTDFASMDGV